MSDWRYADQILRVDLTAQRAQVAQTSLEMKRDFIGGAGFVAHLLSAEGGARPYETQVAMAAGPLSDQMAGRLAMGAVPGPEGRLTLSSMGGRLAAALKGIGYDALVLRGELDRPSCLVLSPDDVRLVPADEMWGKDVPATEEALLREFGRSYTSVVVGPAAENRVSYATLAHEGHYSGGSGVAAALGSQQLKAILFQETEGLPSRCTGCTMECPVKLSPEATPAGALGLDAPMAGRMSALARSCAEAGLLPKLENPLEAIARGHGIGLLLADGEEAFLSRLGPQAAQLVENLPKVRRRGAPSAADLLGTCQRVWRERPGQVLRGALSHTHGLLACTTR